MKASRVFAVVFLALAPVIGWADPLDNVPVYYNMESWEKERLSEATDLEFLTSGDIARLIELEREFLGYVGSDYTRLHIGFTEVRPDEKDVPAVRVSGYLRKGELYCEIEGVVRIDRSHAFKELDYGVDNKYRNAGISRQGMAFGSYELRTTGEKSCAGSLEGRNRVTWMLMEDGSLKRNDIGNTRFLRGDNQYAGVWQRQSNKTPVTANWGEYRIPFARPELDVGSGEFSVNPEYFDHGWQGF